MMIGEWLLLLILAFIFACYSIWPLIKAQGTEDEPSNDATLEHYHRLLAQVDNDWQEKRILDEERKNLKREIGLRIIHAEKQGNGGEDTPTLPSLKTARPMIALFLMASVIIASFILYGSLGTPNIADQPLAERKQGGGQPSAKNNLNQSEANGINRMLAEAEKTLAESPDDSNALAIFARAKQLLGEFYEAESAYVKLAEINDGALRGQAFSWAGEAAVLADDGKVNDRAYQYFKQALEINYGDERAMYYFALRRVQKGEFNQGLKDMFALIQSVPAGVPWRDFVAGRMVQIAQDNDINLSRIGIDLNLVQQDSDQENSGVRGVTSEDIINSQTMSAEDRQVMIEGMVANLASKLDQDKNDGDGWKKLARSYAVLGKLKEADEAFDQAISLQAVSADEVVNHARIIREHNHNRENIRSYELMNIALDLNPNHLEAQMFRAVGLIVIANKKDEGQKELQQILEIFSDDPHQQSLIRETINQLLNNQ